MNKYKFEDSHIPWALEQVWEAKPQIDVYSELSEFEHRQTVQFFPDKPKVIMDLGCGIGRSAIALNWHYNDPDITYILADRQGKTENLGIFFPGEDEYYNDFEATKSFVELNGLTNYIIFDTEKDDWSSLPKIDFVSSRCACGFHFPIDRYMDKLLPIASDNVTMIFGLNQYYRNFNKSEFGDLFKESRFVSGEVEAKFPFQNWLILRDKISIS